MTKTIAGSCFGCFSQRFRICNYNDNDYNYHSAVLAYYAYVSTSVDEAVGLEEFLKNMNI